MLKNLGIVHACFHLPRFRCNAMRKLDGRSLLEWVVRRVTDSILLDGVVLVASGAEPCDAIRRLVPSDIPIFWGDIHGDPLAQIAKCVEEYPTDGIAYLRGDNLFVDPGLIDRLVRAAEAEAGCDYATYRSHDGRPAMLSPASVYAEWVRAAAIRKANRSAKTEVDRRHVTHYIYTHPNKFKLQLLPAPAEIDREDVRLTVDVEEDWEHALTIYEAIGPERLDWQRIARLLDHQPALRSRMASLNRARRDPLIA